MAKIDLSKISTYRLQSEIAKRENAVIEKDKKEMMARRIKGWRGRPACRFVGRAYGLSDPLEEVVMASVKVTGLSSYEYKPSIRVPKSVAEYFHGSWTNNLRSDFQWMLKIMVEYFIDTKIETDLATILDLIRKSSSRDLLDCDKDIREEWAESVVERLSTFPLEELEKYKKGKSKYQPWEYKLLKDTIKYKTENSIPDAKKAQIPQEYKTVLAIGKMENSNKNF